jgi:hypothetical protein
LIEVEEPVERIYQDRTKPNICEITINDEYTGDGNLSFNIWGKDNESGIKYYSYSLDGGENYSDMFMWRDDDNDDKITVMVCNVGVDSGKLVVRIYNGYDMSVDSEAVVINELQVKKDKVDKDSENYKKYEMIFVVVLLAIIVVICFFHLYKTYFVS